MATAYDLTSAPNAAYQIYESAAPLQRRAHRVNIAEDMPALTTGDSAKLISVKAGDYALTVWAQVITPAITTGSTFTVGDSADAAGWITAASATAAANTTYKGNGVYVYTANTTAVTALSLGKIYASADDIIFTQGATAATSGVFEVNALVVPKPFTND